MTLDALKQQYAKIIKIVENVEPERSPETIWRKSLRRFIWKKQFWRHFGDSFGDILCLPPRKKWHQGRPAPSELFINNRERGRWRQPPPAERWQSQNRGEEQMGARISRSIDCWLLSIID